MYFYTILYDCAFDNRINETGSKLNLLLTILRRVGRRVGSRIGFDSLVAGFFIHVSSHDEDGTRAIRENKAMNVKIREGTGKEVKRRESTTSKGGQGKQETARD
jgi:hypothetical protein